VLKKLTYKQKFRITLVAGVLVAFVLFRFPISRTIAFFQDSQKLEKQANEASGAPAKVALLQAQLNRMEQALGKQEAEPGVSKEDALLQIITRYCHDHGALLREFPRAGSYKENGMQVETSSFVVEGDFQTLLALVYQLEQKSKVGRVASVNFQSKRDLKTGTLALSATIYIQNIKKSDA
jgi:hypothetical protein